MEAEETECIRLMVETISELMDPLEESEEIQQSKQQFEELQKQSKSSKKVRGPCCINHC